jgi:hypothetical protein
MCHGGPSGLWKWWCGKRASTEHSDVGSHQTQPCRARFLFKTTDPAVKLSLLRTTVDSVDTHRDLPAVNPFLPYAKSKHFVPVSGDKNRIHSERRCHHRHDLQEFRQLYPIDDVFFIHFVLVCISCRESVAFPLAMMTRVFNS